MNKHSRIATIAVLTLLMLLGASVQPQAQPPQTVREWFEQEHRFLHRYLAVVQQAAHDASYDYKTPALLMPVAIDYFTGYVAHIHRAEEQWLYPGLRQHMTPVQQQKLVLIETDQHEEFDTVKSWQHQLEQLQNGQMAIATVADTIDYLGRMIHRHIVLQEERVWPYVDLLTPQEQTAMLRHIEQFERTMLGAHGRARYEQLLAFIEEQIKALAGRIW